MNYFRPAEKCLHFYMPCLCIAAIAWFIQTTVALKGDVATLLQSTHLMLQGGNYVTDFFIPNPPMILYLYTPPVLLSHLSLIDIVTAFRLYIFLLAFSSLSLCIYLSKYIFASDTKLNVIFISALAFVFFILPLNELGQRDHLFFILIMPYLLLVGTRLLNKRTNDVVAVLIGFLAGICFSIKPHYLMTLVGVESYFFYKKKSVFCFFRPETIAISIALMANALSIFVFFPNYLFVISPYLVKHYYHEVSSNWLTLLFNNPFALLSLIPFCFWCMNFREHTHQAISQILLIALLTFLLSYLTQGTFYYYHIIPALGLSLVLTLFFVRYIVPPSAIQYAYILFMITPFFMIGLIYRSAVLYEKQYIQPLIAFAQTQKQPFTLYALSTRTDIIFPLVDYTQNKPLGHFDALWFIYGLVKDRDHLGEEAIRKAIRQHDSKTFYIDTIASDFHRQKPQFVFIDDFKNNALIGANKLANAPYFNYLSYFLENDAFRQEWAHYQYITTLASPILSHVTPFKLLIYKRIDA